MTRFSDLSNRAMAAIGALAITAMFMATAILPATQDIAAAGMMA